MTLKTDWGIIFGSTSDSIHTYKLNQLLEAGAHQNLTFSSNASVVFCAPNQIRFRRKGKTLLLNRLEKQQFFPDQYTDWATLELGCSDWDYSSIHVENGRIEVPDADLTIRAGFEEGESTLGQECKYAYGEDERELLVQATGNILLSVRKTNESTPFPEGGPSGWWDWAMSLTAGDNTAIVRRLDHSDTWRKAGSFVFEAGWPDGLVFHGELRCEGGLVVPYKLGAYLPVGPEIVGHLAVIEADDIHALCVGFPYAQGPDFSQWWCCEPDP